MIFFVWFTMVFQRFSWNKHKWKKKNTTQETVMEVKWPVLRDEGGTISCFRVEEEKVDFHDSWERQNGLFPSKTSLLSLTLASQPSVPLSRSQHSKWSPVHGNSWKVPSQAQSHCNSKLPKQLSDPNNTLSGNGGMCWMQWMQGRSYCWHLKPRTLFGTHSIPNYNTFDFFYPKFDHSSYSKKFVQT
jgi:hypothetical protein